ncbi:hypothetical protein WJ976_31435 [Achromobacter denitrificans]
MSFPKQSRKRPRRSVLGEGRKGPRADAAGYFDNDGAARTTKTKPRLGSEPGQSRSYCGQSPRELQAAGENVVFGGFRRCNTLKPVISINCPCFHARCGGNRGRPKISRAFLLRENYSGITSIAARHRIDPRKTLKQIRKTGIKTK